MEPSATWPVVYTRHNGLHDRIICIPHDALVTLCSIPRHYPAKKSPREKRHPMIRLFVLLSFVTLTFTACGGRNPNTVVVYTALDEIYSRPILDAFEKESGLDVEVVYDTEAAKTTGLVTRLINEAKRPRCDVFWNNECAQTIRLKERGVLEAFVPRGSAAIPDTFKDLDGFWTGFAARARVILYNTDRVDSPPTSLEDFLKPENRGRGAIALPLFGTTATHAAAIYALWGPEKGLDFFKKLQENEIAILASNSEVRDRVARGEYAFGLTDTDDANGAVEDGLPAKWLLPDQDGMGTLLVPNTLSLIKGAPNAEGGKRLIDYLLSPAVEQRLANSRSIQIPLNPSAKPPENVPTLDHIKVMAVSYAAMADQMDRSGAELRELFVR